MSDIKVTKVQVTKLLNLGDHVIQPGTFIYIGNDGSIKLESGEVVFPPLQTILKEYTDYGVNSTNT
jgi:hypothetical protein